MSTTPIHVLYENPDWMPPVVAGFEAEGFDVRPIHVEDGLVEPASAPPAGLWLNRMSPSSHTRGHDTSVGLTRDLLAWLEGHGAPVINGSAAFELEMSKLRQDLVLRRYGIRTPRTLLAVGRDAILEGAATFSGPFITKHNQGGKGLGIVLFDDVHALRAHLDAPDFEPGPEHKMLLQQYVRPAEGFITRVELVQDRFLFAMRSSTADGFELCPADACAVPDEVPDVCPADGADDTFSPSPLGADHDLVGRYLAMMRGEGLDVAGIEFVTGDDGLDYTYDINGTTNYNSGVMAQLGVDGMREQARYVRRVVMTRTPQAS